MSFAYRGERTAGFSLIELLVALTIGILIAMAIAALYFQNRSSYRLLSVQQRMQEDGRFASLWLNGFLRSAGYRPLSIASASATDTSAEAFPVSTPFTAAGAVVLGSQAGSLDSVDFRLISDTDGSVAGCDGAAPAYSGSPIAYRLYVNSGTLQCTALDTSGNPTGTATSGVSNVTKFVLWFGEDTDSDRYPNRYVRASNVTNWANVRAIRTCLIIQSSEENVLESAQSYLDCNGSIVTAADKRVYRTFGSTVFLRNSTK